MALCFQRSPAMFVGITLFGALLVFLTTQRLPRQLVMLQERGLLANILVHKTSTVTSNNTGIPKIIHQIWNTDMIPDVFHENIKGLMAHNTPPDWTYYFWTLDSARLFIAKHYPALLRRYLIAPNLLKADILRLAVLHHYGGLYFDLDTVSVKPLAPYVDTHDCSLTTDPPEHAFKPDKPKMKLMITNSAMLCKPLNWFIFLAIRRLEVQSAGCRDAIACTGPGFISRLYEEMQSTNKSSTLPIVEDYQLFEDKLTSDKPFLLHLEKHCVGESFTRLKYDWAREICSNWVARGKSQRNISERAFTYHTWFHTYWYPKKLKSGLKNISELVPSVIYYNG